jgi:hypothetical protein
LHELSCSPLLLLLALLLLLLLVREPREGN